MNDQPSGGQPNQQQLVEEGVGIFEQAETRSRKAAQWAAKLVPLFEAANGLAMMGGLQTGRMKAKAMAAAGLIAQAELLLWELHSEATQIAKDNGVDVIVVAGGGPR